MHTSQGSRDSSGPRCHNKPIQWQEKASAQSDVCGSQDPPPRRLRFLRACLRRLPSGGMREVRENPRHNRSLKFPLAPSPHCGRSGNAWKPPFSPGRSEVREKAALSRRGAFGRAASVPRGGGARDPRTSSRSAFGLNCDSREAEQGHLVLGSACWRVKA